MSRKSACRKPICAGIWILIIVQMMGHALPGVAREHYDKPTAQAFIDTVGKAFHINLLHKNDCT